MTLWDQVFPTLTSTVEAIMGSTGRTFGAAGAVFRAKLCVDEDAEAPRGVAVLTPGRATEALVKIAPAAAAVAARSVCIKLVDAYGSGRDQDFLLASSWDGIPGHHAVVHRDTAEGVYSSLWLYLAGWTPTVFGIRAPAPSTPDGSYSPGDRLVFLIANAVSRFHRIGELELQDRVDVGEPVFDAAHCGGGLRALPPASQYRT